MTSARGVRCGHTLDPVEWEHTHDKPCQLDLEDDAGILEESPDGTLVWRCPHVAVTNGRCVFHATSSEISDDTVEKELRAILEGERDAIDGPGPRPPQFIEATFGTLDLAGVEISSSGALDVRHASFDSITWTDGWIPTPVEARGVQISGQVNFGETLFYSTVDFERATFGGPADFSGATFDDDVSFANAAFRERAVRRDPTVKSMPTTISAQFSEANFRGQATFTDVDFRGAAYFREARFGDRALFTGSVVNDWAHFHDARFEGDADFSSTTFESEVRFWNRMTFEKRADFSEATFRGHAGFTGTFQGPVDFSRSAFRNGVFLRGEFNDGVDFSDVDVTSEVILSLVNTTLSKVDFTGTTFPPRTEMNFPGSDFTDFDLSAVEEYLIHPDFEEADLTGVDFSDWNLTGATFTHANLTDATLKNANVSGADFTNAVLVGSDIQQARNVDEAVFSQAIFRTMNLRTRRFTACTLSADVPGDTTQHFEMSSRKAARSSEEYRRTDFSQADFSDADLHNAEFTCANLADAIFDDAICRFTDFRNANLESASFINTDLRSARFDGARIYGATFTNCEMNPDTTITHVDLYDAPPPPRGVLSSQIRVMRRRLSRFLPTRPSDDAVEEDEDTPPTCVEEFGAKSETADADESHSEDEDGGGAEDGRIEPTQSDVEQLRKKAWTHGAIHRQLITTGRHRKALTEKHYLKEQNAKMRRARLKGQLVRRSELWFMKRFLKASEVPAYLLFVIVLFAVGAIVPYLLAGGIRDTATGVHYTPTTLTLEGMGRVFLYSFVTLLDGVYLVIKTPLEDFLPFEVFDQLGSIAVQLLGLSQLEPVGAAAYVHVVVQAMGAVLIVPFSLLVVNHVRTIFGSTTSEEGVDSGFVAWFFGR